MSWSFDEGMTEWARDNLDAFITNWGKNCQIVYPPRWTTCSNCLTNPVDGRSINQWKHGGPLPFPNGSICPLCNGSGGFKAAEQTETIKLICEFTPSRFIYPINKLEIRQPYSLLQTKGYLTDLPKLQKADRLLAEVAIQGITRLAYRMSGEGLDIHNIVQGRYVVVLWERV